MRSRSSPSRERATHRCERLRSLPPGPASRLALRCLLGVAHRAQAAPMPWIVGVSSCRHQIPPTQRPVVGHHARTLAAQHADRIPYQYRRAEPGAVSVTVAALCCRTASARCFLPVPLTPAGRQLGAAGHCARVLCVRHPVLPSGSTGAEAGSGGRIRTGGSSALRLARFRSSTPHRPSGCSGGCSAPVRSAANTRRPRRKRQLPTGV